MTEQDATMAFDHLFEYIHTHWGAPLTASYTEPLSKEPFTPGEQAEVFDCGVMMQMKHNDLVSKLESLPPYFTEAIFPVAVARYMLRDLSVPLAHRKSITFTEFYHRYGRMVLRD
jgi:hypothetical protein